MKLKAHWLGLWLCVGIGCADEESARTSQGPVAPGAGPVQGADAITAPGGDSAVPTDDAGTLAAFDPANPTTYQKHIRPLLEANCVECHTQGGVGPSRFDDWATVKKLGASIVSAVSAGRMPPWPADDNCHRISDSRALSLESKQLFASWKAGGYQEGNASDYVPPAPKRRLELGAPQLVMKPAEAFTPAENSDTYRCFFLGAVATDTYITALDILPGVRSEVHHAQIHRVEATGIAAAQSADEMSAGPGYECGSLGLGSQNMFSYRPGALAVVLAEGDAVYLQGGSGLILQIHYNTQFLPRGEVPTPDQTAVAMWTLPEGQPPKRVVYRAGVLAPLNGAERASFAMPIPANASNVVGSMTVPMQSISTAGGDTFLPGELVGVTPHAHAWATKLTAALVQNGTSKCLSNVPSWDYNWQLDYMFEAGVPYSATDTIHVECHFDNTAENQPIVNGMRTPVADIRYGERTLDEMCLHYVWLRFPYEQFIASRR